MIYVVGIGPGDPQYCLAGQEQWFKQADCILGSDRHLAVLSKSYQSKGVTAPKKLGELEQLIRSYPQEATVVCLVSGDPLIYGLGKWLSEKFPANILIVPGISSVQYLASKICLPMNDAYLTSSHAKAPDFDLIMSLSKVFMVTDQRVGPFQIAQEAVKRGLKKTIVIGEQLSYDDEELTILPAAQIADRKYKMNVVAVLDEGQ